jgi:hypothetical protein
MGKREASAWPIVIIRSLIVKNLEKRQCVHGKKEEKIRYFAKGKKKDRAAGSKARKHARVGKSKMEKESEQHMKHHGRCEKEKSGTIRAS